MLHIITCKLRNAQLVIIINTESTLKSKKRGCLIASEYKSQVVVLILG